MVQFELSLLKIKRTMAEITGIIQIEFETAEPLTKKNYGQFIEFKNKLEKFVQNELEMAIYDIANECGFEADDIHPAILEELEFEPDEEEEK